jgi:magnesium chelatase family protein
LFSYVTSGAVFGITSYLIQVETDLSDGLPGLTMTGSVSGPVRESGERVRVAMKNSGYRLPPSRITVNFSPADIPKKDVILDLPMAAGILICMGILRQDALDGTMIVGELSLDGDVKPVRGVLPMAEEARRQNCVTLIVPRDNAREAAMVRGLRVIGVGSINEMVCYLNADEMEREKMIEPEKADLLLLLSKLSYTGISDLADVHGQAGVKRVLEIAAAGFHNALMIGPPGSGKSMLARCMPGILPPLTPEESIEVTRVYSVAGRLPEESPIILKRPFVAPHHSVTPQALAGGGVIPSPGLISLAHRGVLFLDELPEFARDTLNLLRQPMEEHRIMISRAQNSVTFPARCLVLAAMNPCPCGFYPDRKRCKCTRHEIERYEEKVPGPIIDRFDLCVDVPRVPVSALMTKEKEESSEDVRERVLNAAKRQKKRFAGTDIHFNADMNAAAVDHFVKLEYNERMFIRDIFEKDDLSARAYHKTLKVAQTIADLEGSEKITEDILAEAVGYRIADRQHDESNAAGRSKRQLRVGEALPEYGEPEEDAAFGAALSPEAEEEIPEIHSTKGTAFHSYRFTQKGY